MSAAGSPASEEALRFFETTTENDGAFCRLIKFVSGDLSEQWAAAKLLQNRQTVAGECRAGYLTMFAKAQFVEEVRGLTTPYLVMIGENDPGIDEAAMEKTFLAWHPNAELAVIRNCGHYPMQECPPRFATLLEKFLRKNIG
jgi:pimeloyl-ACP methyl ester carboxylesterase